MTIYNSNLKMVMKKTNLFVMGLLAMSAVSLSSCSTEGTDVTNGTTQNEVTGAQYVTVNIVTSTAGATRADGDNTYTQGNGTYVDGTKDESEITEAAFYLFTAAGQPYYFTAEGTQGGTTNVQVKSLVDDTKDHNTTTEMKKKVQLLIHGVTNTKPAQLVVIANPTDEMKKVHTLAELKTMADDYRDGKGFLMSNSVYATKADGTGTVVDAVQIPESAVTSSQDAAEKAPVIVSIERVLARVGISYSGYDDENNKLYKVGQIGDEDVYAKVVGWNVADGADKTNLIKQINASWKDSDLGLSTWTTSDYTRSFWATSAVIGTAVNYTFDDAKANSNVNYIYTQENTPTSKVTDVNNNGCTKVLVAAQLVKADGKTPVEYCVFGAEKFAGEKNLITKMLTLMKNEGYVTYNKDAESDGQTWADLTEGDVTLVAKGDYEVELTLNDGVTIVKGMNSTTDVTGEAKKFMASTLVGQCAKTGYTYYYAPIKHLGNSGSLAEYGVVRNHAYEVTITDIAGFGTPVYDTTKKTIVPTIPSEAEPVYLAAQCRVLSWRVVTNNTALDQTNKKTDTDK